MQLHVPSDHEKNGLSHYILQHRHRRSVLPPSSPLPCIIALLTKPDYLYDDPNLIYKSKDIWDQALAQDWVSTNNVNFITISHDIHYQTVYNLTNYMLDSMKWLKYGTSVTVGECLGDPKENWYRSAGGAPAKDLLVSYFTFFERDARATVADERY
jgi:hypothetical protein